MRIVWRDISDALDFLVLAGVSSPAFELSVNRTVTTTTKEVRLRDPPFFYRHEYFKSLILHHLSIGFTMYTTFRLMLFLHLFRVLPQIF